MNWLKKHAVWIGGAFALLIVWRLSQTANAAQAAANQALAGQDNTSSLSSLLPSAYYPTAAYSTTAGTAATPTGDNSTSSMLAAIFAAQTDQAKVQQVTDLAAVDASKTTALSALTAPIQQTLATSAANTLAAIMAGNGGNGQYINTVTGGFDPISGQFTLQTHSDINPLNMGQALNEIISPYTRGAIAAQSQAIVDNTSTNNSRINPLKPTMGRLLAIS